MTELAKPRRWSAWMVIASCCVGAIRAAEPTIPPSAIAPFDERQARALQAAWAEHLKQDVTVTNRLGMKFVLIPPGEFMMGSPEYEKDHISNEKQHHVQITRPYYMGTCEVTQDEYEKIMGMNPFAFSSAGELREKVAGLVTRRFPVESVSWYDARKFCERLSQRDGEAYRLPTEAEWEYACRAGTTTAYCSGDSLSTNEANIDGLEVFCQRATGPALGRTTTVGSYKPNAFGLYDMDGNVSEWCSDWLGKDYYSMSPLADPQGPAFGDSRVVRGGFWVASALGRRAALHLGSTPGVRYDGIGFRVVRNK